MKTPKEKYQNDSHYKVLVDLMVNQIEQCKYTPSEMREAAILASIIYAEHNMFYTISQNKEVIDFLNRIEPLSTEENRIKPLSTEEDDNNKRIAEMRKYLKNREDGMMKYKLRKIITTPNPIEEIVSDVLNAIRTGEIK